MQSLTRPFGVPALAAGLVSALTIGNAYAVVGGITDPLNADTVPLGGDESTAGGQSGGNVTLAEFNTLDTLNWITDAPESQVSISNNEVWGGDLIYTKSGPYSDDLAGYANDLTIGFDDSADEMLLKFRADGSTPGEFFVGGEGRGSVGPGDFEDQVFTITFSENVRAFGLVMFRSRAWTVDVFDSATGGNLIDTFTVADINESVVLYDAGEDQSIGRAVWTRTDETSADYRFGEFAVVTVRRCHRARARLRSPSWA